MRRLFFGVIAVALAVGCVNEPEQVVETDLVCLPDCEGRECGDDGCGGSCGVCNDGAFCTSETCAEGLCEATVTDGCYIDETCVPEDQVDPDSPCSTCSPAEADTAWSHLPDGTSCGGSASCVAGSCCDPVQTCADRECGDDGCGGSCGDCVTGESCIEGSCLVDDCSLCLPWQNCEDDLCVDPESTGDACPAGGQMIGTDCADLTVAGCCNGNSLYYCGSGTECPAGEESCLCMVECGGSSNELSCGWSEDDAAPDGGRYMCVKAATAKAEPSGTFPWKCQDVCHPSCDGKQCGDDGCGGSCGECDEALEECQQGQCDCLWEACGDGCCKDGEVCSDGACCAPNCEGKECGDDGCGGTCGACSDDDACNGDEICAEGICQLGEAPQCDDGNPCTDDSCDTEVGCVHEDNTAACDDGDACTTEDACADGACIGGAAPECDDGNPCTDDSCAPESGCTHANNTQPCSDGDTCNGDEICAEGVCQAGEAPDCDDLDACTDDSCEAEVGCVHEDNTAACDDGDACTTEDTCADGDCVGGAAPECDDGNPCTDDSCAPESGCTHANNTQPCSDGDTCNGDEICAEGVCQPGEAPQCDDGNPCTDDSCDAEIGCVHEDNTATCDDGDACTTEDTCADGACVGGAPPECDDGNPCTDDSCAPESGCTHVNNTEPCSDGDACNGEEVCAGGICQSGEAPDCDDLDACTDDSCESSSGCVHVDITADCNDDNLCTDDSCDPLTGCVNEAVDCDDGDACTLDTCEAATGCVNEIAVECDDGNPCTADSCDAETGDCLHVGDLLNGTACDDQNVCTTPDSCTEGICAGIQLPECCLVDEECLPDEVCIDNACVCSPVCDGLDCGPDGCGGFCGSCEAGFACKDGLCTEITCEKAWEMPDCLGDCVPQAWVGNGVCDDGTTGAYFLCLEYEWDGGDCDPCEVDCSGMECGTDPLCNYPCGTCGDGEYCLDGACLDCSCDLIECGIGPCGEDCGDACPDGLACVENACVPMTCEGSCGDQAPTGCYCDDLCFEYGDCCEDVCDFCDDDFADQCSCVPDCDGKSCGSDGCWGTCGTCDGTCVDGQCFDDLGCVESPEPGCDGCDCEECVCMVAPNCCEDQWDSTCIDACLNSCGGCGSMPSCGDGACVPDEGENCMACPEDCGCPESLTCSWLGEDYGFQCFQDICGSELLETRCCDGDVLLVCDIGDGVLLSDCSLDGNICGWYPGSVDYPANYYCGPESVILPEDPSGTYPVECPVSSCIPQCAGKLCGDDGCGGVCGVCGTTNECVDGQCNQITCPSGELPDCVGECFDAAWVGDGYCDDGSWGAYFNCEYYAWDDGDCEPCTPECEGLECGLDPVCAFPCGECNEGASCIDGLCCVPQCEDKLCGADGCGGSCGECEDGLSCEDGLCVCQPDCAEKICGDDGCGGSCGTCGDGLSCMDDGCVPNFVDACDIDTGDACLGPTVKECVPDTAPEPMFGMFVVDCEKHGSTCGYVDAEWGYDCMGCGDLTTSPICDGDLRLHCDEAEDVQMWWNCKWDGANHTCVDGECVCVPACDGKECGDDGCSESCGSCSEGTICLGNDCILAGESCDTAIELNDGVPITEADDGLQLVVYGDTTEMANDLSGSCDDDTGQANDLVYIFTLDEIMDVGIAHDFDGSYHWPAVYIFAEECIVENEVACAEATSGAAVIEPLSLQPGTYFVVVDASYSSDASPFTLTIDFLIPATNETDCTNGQDDDLNGVTDCYDDNCITTDFCVMQNLPWYDDFGDDGDPVLGAFWYSEGNCGWEIAAMADENLAAEFGDAVGCSGVLPYWLASPILDVNACDEISVTMDQAALYTSWAVGHRLALFDGFINVAEIDLDIETLTTAFQTTGPFTFNVSGLDQVRVAAGYLGDDADTWRIDNLTIDCTAAALPNLYYTEYVEGSSLNKAVEIYNAGNAVVDLQNCAIDRYSNGAGYGESVEVPITPAEETLLLPNDVWVVCNAGFEYPSSCDYLTSDLNFNGDDAMALRCSEAVMDTFGMIGEDPGLYWANGDDSVQTKDMTLRRNCSVTQGDINGDDVFDPGAFWTVYSKDSFDDLGSYDCECEDGNCLLFEENLTDGITNTDLFTYSWTGECAGGGYDSEFGESVDSDGQPCLINKLFRHWTCSSAWTENTLATNDVIGEGNFFWTDYVVEVDVKGNTEDGCWPCDTVIHADMEFSITDGSNHVVYYEPQFNSEGVEEGCGCATHYHILNADKRHLWRFHFNSQQQEVSIYKDGLELGNSPMSLVSLNNRWSLRWWGEGHNFQTAYNGNVEFYIYKYIVYSSW